MTDNELGRAYARCECRNRHGSASGRCPGVDFVDRTATDKADAGICADCHRTCHPKLAERRRARDAREGRQADSSPRLWRLVERDEPPFHEIRHPNGDLVCHLQTFTRDHVEDMLEAVNERDALLARLAAAAVCVAALRGMLHAFAAREDHPQTLDDARAALAVWNKASARQEGGALCIAR